MNISNEQIKKLIEILEFYEKGKNFEWDGDCYIKTEFGGMALEGIKLLERIKKIDTCHSPLEDNSSCPNIQCENCALE